MALQYIHSTYLSMINHLPIHATNHEKLLELLRTLNQRVKTILKSEVKLEEKCISFKIKLNSKYQHLVQVLNNKRKKGNFGEVETSLNDTRYLYIHVWYIGTATN